MFEMQKRDLLMGILVAAMLPMEIEAELMDYVMARCPETEVGR